ncbi:MAG: TlyA family rRNA (cytidine-2'-O)-methyltransferase, partial [Planctomycetota bacterium]
AIITLIKPHYEAPADRLVKGILPDVWFGPTVQEVLNSVSALGLRIVDTVESPIRGHAGNRELLAHLVPA